MTLDEDEDAEEGSKREVLKDMVSMADGQVKSQKSPTGRRSGGGWYDD